MSTQQDIQVTYDVSNEFYRLWLDERINYSCAVYEGTDNLEVAQVKKLEWMYQAAKVTPEKRVLDIGCGWGANLNFLARDKGVRETAGITLSPSQYEHIKSMGIPGVEVECIDYRKYQPARPFDGIISIGMFEHIATPEEARSGKHIDIYRDYFRRAWQWTRPGSWFGLQSVIGGIIPRNAAELREMGWATYTIFPGAISPRLEAIVASVSPYWEVMEVKTRREHYEKTSAEWQRRLRAQKDTIVKRWGEQRFEEYDRYLGACVMAFNKGYQSLLQMALKRID
jgi:cyclopropane-fatty-acyl-phospholipid synthase